MNKLSTGQDSTLGNTRELALRIFGFDSPAIKFLDEKIAEKSAETPIIADERQVIQLLANIHYRAGIKTLDECKQLDKCKVCGYSETVNYMHHFAFAGSHKFQPIEVEI